jgi:hypothetical protein
MTGETEQLNEIAVADETIAIDPALGDASNEEGQEFDIVLAGQDEPTIEPESKSTQDHILSRVMKKKDKLADENAALKIQLQQRAQPQQSVQTAPDEYDFDDRKDYLAAHTQWQRQMLVDVTNEQLNTQQNAGRFAAQKQQQEAALTTYAKSAAALKVKDYNGAQDKAFELLGDDFVQMLATQLPEKAPKLIFWFSKNPAEAQRYREEFATTPGKTTFSLGELAGKLTQQPRTSKAAQPESKVESAAVGGLGNDWQRQLNKLDDDVDDKNIAKTLNARRAIKQKAKAAGFDISTLK